MKVQVNYTYKQQYLPTKRCRKARERVLSDTVEVDLNTITDNNFPIAFIIHDMQSVYYGMKSYEDFYNSNWEYTMLYEEVRVYDGKFYKPIRVTHGAAVSTEFEDVKFVISALEKIPTRYWDGLDDNFTENSIIISDTKNAVINAIIDGAKDYVYCDDKFWVRCNEPRYVVNTFGLGFNHGSTGLFIEYYYNANISNESYFNALQRDEAIAYGRMVAANRGDTESIDRIGKYENIEVLMPDVVKLNPKCEHECRDDFLNGMKSIVTNSDSLLESGLACIAYTMANK